MAARIYISFTLHIISLVVKRKFGKISKKAEYYENDCSWSIGVNQCAGLN